MGSPDRTVAVILAAGAGTRFDGPVHKLAAEIDGVPVLDRAVRAAVEARIGTVLVVTGTLRPALRTLEAELDDGRIVLVDNPDWEAGQSTSLQAGVTAADKLEADAIVVGLGDQPFVDPGAWRAVAASVSPIAVASYPEGQRNPVRLHRSVWPLLPRSGDHGARDLIRMRPELVEPIPCGGSPADIDTPEDLHAWQNRSSTNSP